jgi:acyl carrier protein
MDLEKTIKDILCARFGEEYRKDISDETTMADIEGWDSLAYFDVVFALEEVFDITFSDEEMTQLFQVGHIKRIVKAAQLDLPHEDEANAICQLDAVNRNDGSFIDMMVVSASSTREGLLRHRESEALLQARAGKHYRWFNLSVSGLVLAETIQLVEQISPNFKGTLIVGTSPVIWGTCGVAEFERTINFKRFPFAAPVMQNALKPFGYKPDEKNPPTLMTVTMWMERYLKDRNLSDLIYEPYLYPTLPPWPVKKFEDESAIALFYNNSLYNYRQSIEIHNELYYTLAKLCADKGIKLVLAELTLHSKMRGFLEALGQICSGYDVFLKEFLSKTGVEYFDASELANIRDEHFRDPAHIFERKQEYTEAFIDAALPLMAKTS